MAGFAAVVGPVGDFDEDGFQHGHTAGGAVVEFLAYVVFEQRPLVGALGFGVANLGAERFDRLWRHAAAAQAAEGGHTGVVPAVHEAVVHELHKFALARHRMGEVEGVELVLAGPRVDGQLLDVPIVERAMGGEFKGAEAMGDAFDGVFKPWAQS